MSPIIYTPHDCEKPVHDRLAGTLYQCPECDRVWEADSIPSVSKRGGECVWSLVEDQRHDAALRAASTRAARLVTPATPTITPAMVLLALDTYAEHEDFVTRDGREFCAECDAPLTTGPLVLVAHASQMAATALQDALDKAGRDE